jgi:hypothetical protein
VKPAISESPPSCVDKGKTIMKGEVRDIPQPLAKPPIRRKPPTWHHCGELRHIRPRCPYQQAQMKLYWQASKTPMCHQCGVSSHVRPMGPPPQKKSPRHWPPPKNHIPRHLQQQRPTPTKKAWIPKKPHVERPKTLEKETFYEGTPSVSSFMQDLVRYLVLQLKKEEDAHSPRGSRPT